VLNWQLWMRPRWAIIALLVLSAGCDSSAPYRTAVRDQSKALEELQSILATVTDKDSMQSARAQLTKRFADFDGIRRRAQELPPITKEIMRQVEEDGKKVHQALQKVQEQVRRINALPEGPQFLEGFEHMKGMLKGSAS
jgi:hypothetical protein